MIKCPSNCLGSPAVAYATLYRYVAAIQKQHTTAISETPTPDCTGLLRKVVRLQPGGVRKVKPATLASKKKKLNAHMRLRVGAGVIPEFIEE